MTVEHYIGAQIISLIIFGATYFLIIKLSSMKSTSEQKQLHKSLPPRPAHPPVPPKKINLFAELNTCLIDGECQNRMTNGKCTSFVCTKIVRFKC